MRIWVEMLILVITYSVAVAVRRHLTDVECARVVQMIEDGSSQRQVAAAFGVSHSVVSRVVQRHWETGSYRRRPGGGRPRSTDGRDDRHLRLLVNRNPFQSARRLQRGFQDATGIRLSTQTIRNRLHEVRMNARRPALCPVLTVERRRTRLAWAQEHQGWTLDQWACVLFSDESRFCVDTNDGRDRVWRQRGQRYQARNIQQHDRWGGPGLMVWAGISSNGHTDLHIMRRGTVTGQRYLDEILRPVVRPYAGAVGDNFIFMHDNAPAHRHRMVTQFLEEEGIACFDWPPYSPDLNPIEHVWDLLGRRVREQDPSPSNIAELEQSLVNIWANIGQNQFRNFVQSMPRRVQECIEARGGHTSY